MSNKVTLHAPRRLPNGSLALSADLALATGDTLRLTAEVGPRTQAWARSQGTAKLSALRSWAANHVEFQGDWAGEFASIAKAVAYSVSDHPALGTVKAPCCADCASMREVRYDLSRALESSGYAATLARNAASALRSSRD